MSNWTTEQKDFLKRHYNEMPIKEIAQKLNKSEEAIHSKVAYLRKRGWTFNRRNDAIS
jgi:biotin operon repressor